MNDRPEWKTKALQRSALLYLGIRIGGTGAGRLKNEDWRRCRGLSHECLCICGEGGVPISAVVPVCTPGQGLMLGV